MILARLWARALSRLSSRSGWSRATRSFRRRRCGRPSRSCAPIGVITSRSSSSGIACAWRSLIACSSSSGGRRRRRRRRRSLRRRHRRRRRPRRPSRQAHQLLRVAAQAAASSPTMPPTTYRPSSDRWTPKSSRRPGFASSTSSANLSILAIWM